MLKIIFLIVVSIFIGVLTIKASSGLQFILFAFIDLNLISTLLHQIAPNPKHKFIQRLLGIIYFLITTVNRTVYYVLVISHALGPLILIFGGQFITLTLLNKYIFNDLFLNSTIGYLSGLSTFCILAYKSYWVVDIAIKFFTKSSSSLEKSYNRKIICYFKRCNFRKICYLWSILICIALNAINLTVGGVTLDNFTATMDKILLTFVAIDCYVCTFNPEVFKKTNIELDRLYDMQAL